MDNNKQATKTSSTNVFNTPQNATPLSFNLENTYVTRNQNSVLDINLQNARYLEEYHSVRGAIEYLANKKLYPLAVIDETTAVISQTVLSVLEWLKCPAPRIFSHGGDAVVFRWDKAGDRIYITITDEEAAISTVMKDDTIGNITYIDIESGRKVANLTKLLGDGEWKMTSTNP